MQDLFHSWVSPRLFANCFSLKSLGLSLKTYMNQCGLKLTDLWITTSLFDLNYKFINGSFVFSPGEIYIVLNPNSPVSN